MNDNVLPFNFLRQGLLHPTLALIHSAAEDNPESLTFPVLRLQVCAPTVSFCGPRDATQSFMLARQIHPGNI